MVAMGADEVEGQDSARGRPGAARGVHRRTPAAGRFAQELAAADDRALMRLRVRAERAEATLADLRRDAARAILSLRRQVEFWRHVADGVEPAEAAGIAGLAGTMDLADPADGARAAGGNDLAELANIANIGGKRILHEQADVATFSDATTSEIADLAGSSGDVGRTDIGGKSGKPDDAGGVA